MIIKRILAVVLSAAFIATAYASDKDSLAIGRQKKGKLTIVTKNELKRQNSELRSEIDSIRNTYQRLKILQPGNCLAFGSAFKVPVSLKMEKPNCSVQTPFTVFRSMHLLAAELL